MKLKALGIAAVVAVAATGFVLSTGTAKAELCTLQWKPVCANDHGFTHTYTNACLAKLWGAKVLYNGECGAKPKKAHKKAAKKMAKPAKKEMKKK